MPDDGARLEIDKQTSSVTSPEEFRPVSPSGAGKRSFPAPAEKLTQEGPLGIRFDFNDGGRVLLPLDLGPWRVRLSDIDSGNILYETQLEGGQVVTTKRYFLNIQIDVWKDDKQVFQHRYDARDQEILIQFPVGTLGDTLGWLPYAVRFREQHGCNLTCAMAEVLIPLFREVYPDIEFVSHESVDAKRYYATYNLGLFFDDDARVYQPCDFRLVGLHRTAGYILGVDPIEEPPRIAVPDGPRPIVEPYVCIAAQSSTQAKYWNNPMGWREVVKFLKASGYRVVCIDQKAVHGTGLIWNHMPGGAEDETGDRPLSERARWLRHAEFFIGLSSGLSWLAWAVGTPVVMLSGFTHPTNEFQTPYRVINYHGCNSCWNDVRVRFDHNDFLWCPHHKDTPRQFECTRLITPGKVIATIQKIPGFGQNHARTFERAAE